MIWNHFIWNFDEIFETLYFTVLFALNANLMYVYMFFKKKIYDYAIQFKIRTSSWGFLWHLIFGQVQPACDFPVFAISQICWVLCIWLSHSGFITGWRMFIARMFYIKLLGTVYSFDIGLHLKHRTQSTEFILHIEHGNNSQVMNPARLVPGPLIINWIEWVNSFQASITNQTRFGFCKYQRIIEIFESIK